MSLRSDLAIRAARASRAWRVLALLIVALAAPSCGGGGGDPTGPSGGGGGGGNPPVTPTPVVSVVAVAPTPVALSVGGTQQISATPRDASGAAVSGRVVSWKSSNAAVATVASGMVTAVGAGSATITATCDGIDGTAAVTVTAPVTGNPVNRIVLTPEILSLGIGGTGKYTAALYDAAGAPLTGRTVTWTSSNQAVATVAADGTVKGIAGGQILITATSEGKSTQSQAIVNTETLSLFRDTEGFTSRTLELEQGEGKYIEMLVYDAVGSPVLNPLIAAASSDSSVATINRSDITGHSQPGFLIGAGMKMGPAKVTLASGGLVYTANVTALSRVDSVFVSPASLTVPQDETRQLTVTLKDLKGNVVTGRAITYVSLDGSIASVDAAGVVTGRRPGTTTINVSRSGRLVAVPVTVVPPTPVATVSLTPTTIVFQPGGTQQLTAVTKDAAGNVLQGRSITYASSAPAIATVSATGLVKAIAVGNATITATSEGRSATAALSVLPPVASIAIEPATALMHPGEGLPLTVTVKDAAGNTLTGRNVTLTSNAPGIARADTAYGFGVVAGAVGNATITASAEGQSASMTVRVVPPPTVASVKMTPASITLYANTSVNAQILAYDSAGNALGGRVITMSSGNPAVATAAPIRGFESSIAGVAAGTTTVTATCEGKSTSIAVTVNPAQVVGSVRMSQSSVSLVIGESDALSVTQLDTRGLAMAPPHAVTWSSSNAGIVSVNTSGTIRANAYGSASITATVDGKSASATVTVTSSPPVVGGGGGGGTGSGTVCAFQFTVGRLTPGQSTVSSTPSFPGGIDIVVTAGTTNTGTASAPRYPYTVKVTNRYTSALTASFGMSTSDPATSTDRRTFNANSVGSLTFTGLPPNTTMYLLIEKVSFGTSTAYYCK